MANARKKRFGNGRSFVVRSGCVSQTEPAQDDGQSRHVRGRDRQRDHDRAAASRVALRSSSTCRSRCWLWFTVLFANFAEAMAEGRGKAQADTLRKARSETIANRLIGMQRRATRRCQARSLRTGDLVFVSAGEFIPVGRRDHRRRCVGRRIGHHRRVCSGDSRSRRRSLRGHRRDSRPVRPDQGENHIESGRDLSRPHDRAGGGRRASEDAERDRAQHPAGRT